MKVPAGCRIGVATHTGRVRTHNEDDFLVGTLDSVAPPRLLVAIADGMGGVAGGADASRLALRAFASAVLDGAAATDLAQLGRDGCTAAARRIAEQADATPALRGMGTTLTAVVVCGDRAQLVHVGDSRLYRRRAGALQRLTTDHAVREPDNRLLRCVGGGSRVCVPDLAEVELRPGDRLLLCTDGVWSVVPDELLQAKLGGAEPQAVAEAVVAEALARGGPDNATAMVLEVTGTGTGCLAVELPRGERPGRRADWPPAAPLRAPRWPWWVLAVALAAGLAWLRQFLGADFPDWLPPFR
jgi:protein phosphatase